jgi:hypothetical protein
MMMRAAVAGFRKFPWIVLAAFALAGCATSDTAPPQGGDSSNPIRNLLMYGGTTVPEPMKEIKVEDEIECPAVEIREGGSTLRNGSAQAVSTQFSIRGLARECRADGESIIIKVGVEVLAIIGTAGRPGTASAPLSIVVKRGDKILVTRTKSASVNIPADEGQALFTVIEDGIKVPKSGAELSITVGLGR